MAEVQDIVRERAPPLENADWPTFGWVEDMRPALGAALSAKRPVALATLYQVLGSAPRGPGAQMLFDGDRAFGYFSGGCVEADVARHAADVIADGMPRLLHYGVGSPWVDIELACGGAIHIFVEKITADDLAARALIQEGGARRPALWVSDGRRTRVEAADADAPLFSFRQQPLTIRRRYDPPIRVIVSGGDPTALAIAKLAIDAQFETFIVRASGPSEPPPVEGATYLRARPREALKEIGCDAWTAFVGAAHDPELDVPACAAALAAGASYIGLVGAGSRAPERQQAMLAAGAPEASLTRLHAPAGMTTLGKAPWRIAIGVIAEIAKATTPHQAPQ
ncbi:MAG: XdhC family protein [Alphaproteobacteria bacterium]